MRAEQLRKADGTLVDAWMCGECRTIYASRDGYVAGRCCVCRACGVSVSGGKPNKAYKTHCDACEPIARMNREAKRMERATLVPDWDGPVYVGDRYFEDVEAAADWYECDGDSDPPEFAYCCTTHYLDIDGESVLNNVAENAGIDECEYGSVRPMNGEAEFLAAVEAFNKANAKGAGTPYWDVDYSRKTWISGPVENDA